VPTQLVVDMRERLGFDTVLTGYGLTETHGLTTICRHDDPPEVVAKTVGRPLPDVEVRVVDEAGRVLGTGEPGEVVIRGYNLMSGYFDDPVATAEAIDGGGWLHTGDVGVVDADGNLLITDRLKDMFIVGGFNAYPAEIENRMSAYPGIASVAVVGVPDERLGEVGMAFVVPATGVDLDRDALTAWCREHLSNYKVPRYVEVVDALPLNASSKVLKYELAARGRALVGGGRDPASPA
jgi:acyl-CoA synthetase (AMP-forming)/AMP-acid ligase II